jgi:pimeloyl-ACP methyl ester carboxylesterase
VTAVDRRAVLAGGFLAIAVVAFAWRHEGSGARYVPKAAALKDVSIYVFAPPEIPPRATILFLGNDVGFWKPHEELAAYLATQGYGVVGVDVRPIIHSTGKLPLDARDSAFRSRLTSIVVASMDEFASAGRPFIVMGHSLGGELAVWAAANLKIPQLVGAVAMSPGSRSHLGVSLSDLLETSEPTGPGSFAVADEVKAMPPGLKLVVIRGRSDKYRYADSAIVAAGPDRVTVTTIPLAGHSLKRIVIAKYYVRGAIESLLK